MTKGLRVESSAATRTERITAVIGLKYSSQLHDWAGVSRVLTGHEVVPPAHRSRITGILAAAVRDAFGTTPSVPAFKTCCR